MIVYAGKQYGNDFNNGDEALFQDANRPRDEDKFKIRPGMQSGKWDWRGTNKGISYGQFQAKSIAKVPGTLNGQAVNLVIPEFKAKYTSSDFSDLSGYTQLGGTTYTTQQLADFAGNRANGKDSQAMFRDGMVYISKSGSYMIETSAQFYRPTTYDSTNSYLTKMWAFLYYGTKKDEMQERSHRQNRAVGFPDYLDYWTVADIAGGTYLTMGSGHTFKNGTSAKDVMVGYALNLYRLS